MDERIHLVRQKAIEVFREMESPFSKWEFFKRYSAQFGSKPPLADLGYASLCDFIESFPAVQIVRSPGLYAFNEEKPTEKTPILLKTEDSQESEEKTKPPSPQIIKHDDDESSRDEDGGSEPVKSPPSEASEDVDGTDQGIGAMTGKGVEKIDEEKELSIVAQMVKDSNKESNKNSSEEDSITKGEAQSKAGSIEKTSESLDSTENGHLELSTVEPEEEEPKPEEGNGYTESSTMSEKPAASCMSREESIATDNEEHESQVPEIKGDAEKTSISVVRVHLETSDEEQEEEKENTVPLVEPNEIRVTTATLPTLEEFKARALALAETLPPSFHVTRFSSAYCVKYCVSSVPFRELGFSTMLECFHEMPKIFNRLMMSGETTPSPPMSFEGAERSPVISPSSSFEDLSTPPLNATMPLKEFQARAVEVAAELPSSFDIEQFHDSYCEKYSVSSVPFKEFGYSTLIGCLEKIPEIADRVELILAPTSLDEFKTRAIEVTTQFPYSNSIPRFSQAYCKKYHCQSVPYKELGFSTLLECLQAIPAVAARVDMSLEMDVLDIIRPWKRAFALNSLHFHYRQQKGQYLHFKRFDYSSIYQLLVSLPGVRQIDFNGFIYEGQNSKEATSTGDKTPFPEKTPIQERQRGGKELPRHKEHLELSNPSSRGSSSVLEPSEGSTGRATPILADTPILERPWGSSGRGRWPKPSDPSKPSPPSSTKRTPILEHPQFSFEGGMRSPYTSNEPKTFPPLNLTLFNARALTAVADRCQFCCVRQFSQIYCEFYRTHYVPYFELGFSTLLECLQGIPEISNYVDMNFELDVLDIISNYKTPFRPHEVVKEYHIRNNVAVVPLLRYGYKHMGDLLCSLPGVTMNGGYTFSYERKKKQSECDPEPDRLSNTAETESICTNETKSLPEVSSSFFRLKNCLESISDAPKPTQTPPHCPCQSAATQTSFVSRNESIGRFITSLLDDADRKGLNTNDVAMRTINFAMGFYPKTTK